MPKLLPATHTHTLSQSNGCVVIDVNDCGYVPFKDDSKIDVNDCGYVPFKDDGRTSYNPRKATAQASDMMAVAS